MSRPSLEWAAAAALLAGGCGGKEGAPPDLESPRAIEVEHPEMPLEADLPVPSREPRDPHPGPPAAQPPREAPPSAAPSEPPIDAARILAAVRADPERLARELRDVPERDLADPQTRLAADALGMALASVLGEPVRAYEAALGIEKRLRPFTPLAVRNLCFTTGADGGYGAPERAAKAVFKPGALLNVYCEVDRLSQAADGDKFSCRFDADLRVETADGQNVWEFEQWEKAFKLRDRAHVSGRYHTDFYFHYKGLPLPHRMNPGSYRLVLEFSDLGGVEPRRASASAAFEVVAP